MARLHQDPMVILAEFGHMTINPDSDIICDCGQKGCLEALASGRRIAELAREKAAESSILIELC